MFVILSPDLIKSHQITEKSHFRLFICIFFLHTPLNFSVTRLLPPFTPPLSLSYSLCSWLFSLSISLFHSASLHLSFAIHFSLSSLLTSLQPSFCLIEKAIFLNSTNSVVMVLFKINKIHSNFLMPFEK